MKNQDNQITLSIITVVFNAEKQLEKTIRSIIDQEFKSYEHLVIDGGSTDGTVNIINAYSKHIKYWLSEPDNGIYDAMNKGLDASSGNWIIFLNAGDEFYDNQVLNSIDFSVEARVIYGGYFSPECGAVNARPISYLMYRMPSKHQSFIYKRSIIRYALNYKVASDYDYTLQHYKCFGKNNFLMLDRIICKYDEFGFSTSYPLRSAIEQLHIKRRSVGISLLDYFLTLQKLVINFLKKLFPRAYFKIRKYFFSTVLHSKK